MLDEVMRDVELVELFEMVDVARYLGDLVVGEIKFPQFSQAAHSCGNDLQTVVTQIQESQMDEPEDRFWEVGDLVMTQVEHGQMRKT